METKIWDRESVTKRVIDVFLTAMAVAETPLDAMLGNTKRPAGEVTEHSVIKEVFPDMDHLDRIAIVGELEAVFSVCFYNDDISFPQAENGYKFEFKFTTIKEFVNCIIEKLNGKKGELTLEIE